MSEPIKKVVPELTLNDLATILEDVLENQRLILEQNIEIITKVDNLNTYGVNYRVDDEFGDGYDESDD